MIHFYPYIYFGGMAVVFVILALLNRKYKWVYQVPSDSYEYHTVFAYLRIDKLLFWYVAIVGLGFWMITVPILIFFVLVRLCLGSNVIPVVNDEK